jgi:hypothetical protein
MRKIQQQNVSTEKKDEDKHKRKQKDQSRALAMIILALFLSFFLSFRMPRDTWLVAAVPVH